VISDESDEAAASLDDEALIRSYLRPEENPAQADSIEASPDWPDEATKNAGISVDPAIKAWFAANHQDWHRQMRLVLSAWVAAQAGPDAAATGAGGETPPAATG
jgi:hypothetical protein